MGKVGGGDPFHHEDSDEGTRQNEFNLSRVLRNLIYVLIKFLYKPLKRLILLYEVISVHKQSLYVNT